MQQISASSKANARAARTRRPPLGPSVRGAPVAPLPSRVTLTSSNLRAAEYDVGTQTLIIDFQGGRRYEYNGVPQNIYAGLLRAPSHGQYFHQWIRNRTLTATCMTEWQLPNPHSTRPIRYPPAPPVPEPRAPSVRASAGGAGTKKIYEPPIRK
ncbi:MAG: KTSC domain-containing protein [Myxococcales bacterium]|nr:KTSC domain-containing protein [Myxococcales bacterium]